MTRDPRFEKLPKWAQEAFLAVELQAALSWPGEPRPTPLWEPGVNTYAPSKFHGRTVWQAIETTGVEPVEVSQGHIARRSAWNGSRPEYGRFFATEREAWLDVLWQRCLAASRHLHAARVAMEATE